MLYADDFLNRNSTKTKITISENIKGTVTGAMIGALGGGLYSYFRKTKFTRSILIGAAVGGLVSTIFLIKK